MVGRGGLTEDAILAQALVNNLDAFDQIDRMIAQTEARSNAMLREIDRHRAAVAQRLRRESRHQGRRIGRGCAGSGGRTMSSPARIAANRRNAQLSTGPKSEAGKSRVARNALRHGLATPVALDPALAPEIERLAREIAGGSVKEPWVYELARRVADAQIYLVRVCAAKRALLAAPAPPKEASNRDLTTLLGAVARKHKIHDAVLSKRHAAAAHDPASANTLESDNQEALDEIDQVLAMIGPHQTHYPESEQTATPGAACGLVLMYHNGLKNGGSNLGTYGGNL